MDVTSARDDRYRPMVAVVRFRRGNCGRRGEQRRRAPQQYGVIEHGGDRPC